MSIVDELNQIATSMGKPNLVTDQTTATSELKNAYQNYSAEKEAAKSRIFNDPTINQLGQYEQQVTQQLFTEPTSYLTEMSNPDSPNYVADPMKRLNFATQRQGTVISKLLGIKKSIEKRKGDLQELLNAWTDEYEMKIAEKKLAKEELDDAFSLAWDIVKEQQRRIEKQQEESRKPENVAIGIANDVQAGMTLDEVMKKYRTKANSNDIYSYYNTYSSWGPAKESAEVLYQKYGVVPEVRAPETIDANDPVIQAYVSKIKSNELKLSNIPAEKRDAVVLALSNVPLTSEERDTKNEIVSNLERYKTELSGRKLAGLIPLTPDRAKIETLRKLLVIQIARLYEKGRMSDKDRDYYAGIIPTAADAVASPEYAKQAIDQIISILDAKYGGQSDSGSSPKPTNIGRFSVEVE